MANWIGRIKEFAYRLEQINVKLSEEDKILGLTAGLDETYEAFLISIDALPEKLCMFEHAQDRLLNEEVRRSNNQEEQKIKTEALALVAREKPVCDCWNCGKPGHIKAHCKAPPKSEDSKKSESNNHQANLVYSVSHLRELPEVESGREIGEVL
ncbi:hypothetical protein M422DRAFT_47103 [Sphaerobolus stellatus SS14]|uniref:CCHC-type domain-containing protein n=1 Tax=Sphaerobolus stellatus (strain SS14) TaxID=990650 RepID=A0A0C9VRC8_SPHS4|nr:hypothetical protein M422DRAFT_47103 [Sphaerobolus stellatus SS14]